MPSSEVFCWQGPQFSLPWPWRRTHATSDPCANSPDDHALRACRASDLDAATAELKEVAAELSQSLSEGLDGNAEALATAQADWDRFMRSECRLINFESLSGTAGDIYEMECLSTMTRARTKLSASCSTPRDRPV